MADRGVSGCFVVATHSNGSIAPVYAITYIKRELDDSLISSTKLSGLMAGNYSVFLFELLQNSYPGMFPAIKKTIFINTSGMYYV